MIFFLSRKTEILLLAFNDSISVLYFCWFQNYNNMNVKKKIVLQIGYRTAKIMHSFKMVRMRQVSFALRDNKIMPQGKNSGSLKLTVTTKGRRNWGCVHPQSSFRRPGIKLCTPRFSYLPPPLSQELFWSVMLYTT